MSTNKTSNYHLHSWLPTDDFLLSEINANFASLDAVVASKAAQTALTALSANLQSEARTRAEAVSALAAADLRLLTGQYVGNEEPIHITLGVKPLAVIVEGLVNYQTTIHFFGLAVTGHDYKNSLFIKDDGFTALNGDASIVMFSYGGLIYNYMVLY